MGEGADPFFTEPAIYSHVVGVCVNVLFEKVDRFLEAFVFLALLHQVQSRIDQAVIGMTNQVGIIVVNGNISGFAPGEFGAHIRYEVNADDAGEHSLRGLAVRGIIGRSYNENLFSCNLIGREGSGVGFSLHRLLVKLLIADIEIIRSLREILALAFFIGFVKSNESKFLGSGLEKADHDVFGIGVVGQDGVGRQFLDEVFLIRHLFRKLLRRLFGDHHHIGVDLVQKCPFGQDGADDQNDAANQADHQKTTDHNQNLDALYP